MKCASIAVPDPSLPLSGLTCDNFSAWWVYFVAVTGDIDEVGVTEEFEAAETLLSDRCALVSPIAVGEFDLRRYREFREVENLNMTKKSE